MKNFLIKNLTILTKHRNIGLKLKKRLSVFCDKISEVKGHDIKALFNKIDKAMKNKNTFEILIAKTIKGKGIRSMENNPEWHHKAPSKEEMKNYKLELKI